MTFEDINIRDPYILLFENTYYLYGTRSKTLWTKASGFDCYVSSDLKDWKGPYEVFDRPKDFWADRNFWAPECIYYKGDFYLISTFGVEGHKAIQILKSKEPLGPFEPMTDKPLTSEGWNCIDWDVYFTDGPTAYRLRNGKLIIIWSSWGEKGYSVGMALSESGKMNVPWKHLKEPLYEANGGHGMVFANKLGKIYYILHNPNGFGKEHPVVYELEEAEDRVYLNGSGRECSNQYPK